MTDSLLIRTVSGHIVRASGGRLLREPDKWWRIRHDESGSGNVRQFRALTTAVDDVLWASDLGGRLFKSENGGVTLTDTDTMLKWGVAVPAQLRSSLSGQYVWASRVSPNVCWVSSDYGDTWDRTYSSTGGATSRSTSMSDTGQYMRVPNIKLYSNDYGATWQTHSFGLSNPICWAVSPSGQVQIMTPNDFSNQKGKVFRSTDYGANFSELSIPLGGGSDRTLMGLEFASIDDGAAAVAWDNQGGYFLVADQGASWSSRMEQPTSGYMRISDSGTHLYTVVSGSSNIYKSSDGGDTWLLSDLGTNFKAGPNLVFFRGSFRAVMRRDGSITRGLWFSHPPHPSGLIE